MSLGRQARGETLRRAGGRARGRESHPNATHPKAHHSLGKARWPGRPQRVRVEGLLHPYRPDVRRRDHCRRPATASGPRALPPRPAADAQFLGVCHRADHRLCSHRSFRWLRRGHRTLPGRLGEHEPQAKADLADRSGTGWQRRISAGAHARNLGAADSGDGRGALHDGAKLAGRLRLI